MSIVKGISILGFFLGAQLNSCPACIGRLDETVPPFFTKEYDAHWQKSSTQETTNTASREEQEQKKEKES